MGVVQDGQFGALEKKQKITEACRGGKRTSPFRGPLQRNIKGQSWLTQFSATSVEARLKMKEEKKINKIIYVLRHQQACIMGM